MSHKYSWRSFAAATSLLLTSSAAYSQPEIPAQIDLTKAFIPNAEFIVLDANLAEPDFFIGAGGFGPAPVCQFPPGGRPPFMPPGGPHPGGPMMMPPPIFMGVDLTDDQIGRIAKLKRAFEVSNAASHQSLRSSEIEMRDLLSSSDFNEGQIRKLTEEIAQQKSDESKRFSMHMLEIAKVLTPQQRQKIKLNMDKMELGPMFGPPPPNHHPGGPGFRSKEGGAPPVPPQVSKD